MEILAPLVIAMPFFNLVVESLMACAELNSKSLAAVLRSARGNGGALVLAGRGLRELPPAVWSPPELDADEKWWETCDLVKLDVAHNQLDELPNELALSLTLLQTVIASHNRLVRLPVTIGSLSALRILNVSSNALESLPAELAAVATLHVLDASSNALRDLGSSLPRGLRELKLDGNRLMRLPDLRCSPQLESLSVARNQLAELPPSVGVLRRLTSLVVSENSLTALPDLGGAESLVLLDARTNRLSAVPALPRSSADGTRGVARLFLGFNSIRKLDGDALARTVAPTLAVLGLNDNGLKSLPDSIGALGVLRLFDVSNNSLSEIPGSLGYIRSLNKILVTGNGLRALRPATIAAGVSAVKTYLRTRGPPHAELPSDQRDDGGEYDAWALTVEAVASADPTLSTALRDAAASGSLNLAGCDPPLRKIPDAALDASLAEKLVALDLSRNAITALGERLEQLPRLEEVTLDTNELREPLPAALATLSLRTLRMRQNFLENGAFSRLSDALRSRLTPWTLTELDIRGNRLRAVPHVLLGGIPKLRILLLGNNAIRLRREGAAAACWRALRSLHTVDLGTNKVESLPVGLLRLPSLTSLNIENNEIKEIPAELGLCTKLKALMVGGNPQRRIRPNIIARGTDAVLATIRDRAPREVLASISAARSEWEHGGGAVVTRDDAPAVVDARPPAPRPAPCAASKVRDDAPTRDARARAADAGFSRAPAASQRQRQQAPPPRRTENAAGFTNDGAANDAAFGDLCAPLAPPSEATAAEAAARDAAREMIALHATVSSLENELEFGSGSRSKKFAIKKNMQRARASLIRLERKAGLRR